MSYCECVQGSFGCVQGSFGCVQGSFECVYGSFESQYVVIPKHQMDAAVLYTHMCVYICVYDKTRI